MSSKRGFVLVITIVISVLFLGVPSFGQTPVSQITAVDVFDPTQDWGLSYFNLASSAVDLTDSGPASWNVYQYLAANYRWDFSRRLSIRLPYTMTTPGVHDRRNNVRSFDMELADIHFVYNQFNWKEFPGEWDLSTSYYVYLPTSQNAQEKRWMTRLRAWFNFEKKLSRRTLMAIWIKPDYYVNTQKAYRSERVNVASDGTTFTRVNAYNNVRGELETSLVFTYGLNKILSPQLSVTYSQLVYEDSQFVRDRTTYRDSIGLTLGTWIQATRQLRFLVNYTSEQGLTNALPWQQNALFTPSQSQYTIMTFWNFF